MDKTRNIRRPGHGLFRTRAIALSLLASACLPATQALASGYTGVFGGGPIYKNPNTTISELGGSGFTEVIVWSVEVKSNGDLNLNNEFPLVSNGAYVGNSTHADFPSTLATLKQHGVTRITLSIGSSNAGDFQNIESLVSSQGTGEGSILYKDFTALKAAIPSLDAIDLDDENNYDTTSTVAFSVMLGKIGFHVIPDAYTNMSYWQNLVSQINAAQSGTVDAVHLQAYAGGDGNNPCDWNFGGVPVLPGVWDQEQGNASQAASVIAGWYGQCGIKGAFLWLYDDVAGQNLAAGYASAFNTALGK